MARQDDFGPPETQDTREKRARLWGALALLGVLILLGVVLSRTGAPPQTHDVGPHFDPETTDNGELRRVTEAVSRILSAGPGRPHVEAVEGLEVVSVNSAGARDLKESCVNTYRGTIEAERLTSELRTLIVLEDGGTRTLLSPEQLGRAAELERNARERVRVVGESHDRCLDLYLAAAQRLGLIPVANAHRTPAVTGSGSGP